MLHSLKIFFIFLSVLLSCIESASAQNKMTGNANNEQVVLTSEGGMEWNSNKKTLSAEVKALAVRGDTALGADKIVAYYRDEPDKETEIFQVRAFGNVIIRTPRQVVYADTGVYEIEKSVIILKGNPVKLYAGDETMTSKVLELWQDKNMAIARNNVVAVKDARRLEAETVKAFFVRKGNQTEVERFEAEENVVLTNDKEVVQGDFGVYLVDKETASLQGNVKISQGGNHITGEVADINMRTGVSRLQTPSEKGKSRGQVRGVFIPEGNDKKKKAKPAAENVQEPTISEESVNVEGSETNEKLLSSSTEGN